MNNQIILKVTRNYDLCPYDYLKPCKTFQGPKYAILEQRKISQAFQFYSIILLYHSTTFIVVEVHYILSLSKINSLQDDGIIIICRAPDAIICGEHITTTLVRYHIHSTVVGGFEFSTKLKTQPQEKQCKLNNRDTSLSTVDCCSINSLFDKWLVQWHIKNTY